MKLICKLIGHNSSIYLQATEKSSDNNIWIEDDKTITKKIYTYFLCKRCLHRYKQTEIFYKERD